MIKRVNQNYHIVEGDQIVHVDTTKRDIRVALPKGAFNQSVMIRKSAGDNKVIVTFKGQDVFEVTEIGQIIKLFSDGEYWYLESSNLLPQSLVPPEEPPASTAPSRKKVLIIGKTPRLTTEMPKLIYNFGFDCGTLYLDINASLNKNGEEFVAENYLDYDLLICSFLQESSSAPTPEYLKNEIRKWFYNYEKPVMETMLSGLNGTFHNHNVSVALDLVTETYLDMGVDFADKAATSRFMFDITRYALYHNTTDLSLNFIEDYALTVNLNKPYVGTPETVWYNNNDKAIIHLVDKNTPNLKGIPTPAKFAHYGSFYSRGNHYPTIYNILHLGQVLNWLLEE